MTSVGSASRQRSRRHLLAAGLVAAVGSCARTPSSADQSQVSILREPSYRQTIYEDVRRLLSQFSIPVRGKKVVLKPNLVEFDANTVINTHAMVVHAAMEAFRALGAAQVLIAEGPGHRRVTLEIAEAAGYVKTIPDFENAFVDLNLDSVSDVALRRPVSKLTRIHLPRTVLGADLLVSIPKLKTHHWVGATLSMKNLFGVVPGAVYGWPKNVLHWAGIEECIVDLHRTLPARFCLVDGIDGMEGNGPIQGKTKHAGVLVAGFDSVAVDATCCRIMGIDPARVRYLQLAETAGQMSEKFVRQIGEPIRSVMSPFELLPQFEGLRAVPSQTGA